MTKKILALMLSMAICIGALTGCKKENVTAESESGSSNSGYSSLDNLFDIDAEKLQQYKSEIQPFLFNFFQVNLTGLDLNNVDDKDTFMIAIKIMTANEEYTKENGYYYFKNDTINQYAESYLQKEKFNFNQSDAQFVFDEDRNSYKSQLAFGILDNGPEKNRSLEITNIKTRGSDIIAFCLYKEIFKDPDESKNDYSLNYKITLGKKDLEYNIKHIEKT